MNKCECLRLGVDIHLSFRRVSLTTPVRISVHAFSYQYGYNERPVTSLISAFAKA